MSLKFLHVTYGFADIKMYTVYVYLFSMSSFFQFKNIHISFFIVFHKNASKCSILIQFYKPVKILTIALVKYCPFIV